MGVNRIFKFLIVSIFITSFFCCRGEAKNTKDVIVDTTSVIDVRKENNFSLNNSQVNLKPKDFIFEFYTKYIKYLEDPLNEESVNLKIYLTEDLINKIGKVKGYNYIINAQDSTIEWLKTLKVEDTEKNSVYSVSYEKGYYDSDDNILYVTIIEKEKLKISKISSFLDDQLVSSKDNDNDQDEEFTYYAFDYKINPGDRINETSYIIEYLEEEYIVFIMMGYEGNFDFKCRQVRTNEGVSLYYKESMDGGEEYTGDKSKPIVKIYKRVNNFYAKSSLIENGKEIKLKQVESRY
ncbi:hypothetical protein D1818_13775 [Aquimarina sp. BL5]|uniref:hypothetical protein n=1 Tax=Aquimarina sp. BL5 TaxID=1714860 RepID=UPI000E510D6E|nr:hypothetical protein [Aquimarina sp. BL5]AXT51860.1 hypothetical protein D1818_13775 [Aquimarina sp. BL5]RKM99831.1 hypothetical protein D7036_19770 [Aquimarina sp. BL5]